MYRDLPVTIRINGRPRSGVLVRGSRPGTYNIWPADAAGNRTAGNALETRIMDYDVARRFPEHASTIQGRPDTSG